MNDPATPPSHRHQRDPGLALIAIFKLVKTILLVIIGLGATNVLGRDLAEQARQWVSAFSFPREPQYMRALLAWASGLSAVRIRELGIVAFGYATLYAVEGMGLWLEKQWAEYLTIIATGSFIPIELYELTQSVTGPKLVAFTLNVLIVGYLAYLIERSRTKRLGPRP